MGNEKSLENMLNELEQIATDMDNEDISLDSALEKYEEGIKLYRNCVKTLEEAQLKIEVIKKENNLEIENEF